MTNYKTIFLIASALLFLAFYGERQQEVAITATETENDGGFEVTAEKTEVQTEVDFDGKKNKHPIDIRMDKEFEEALTTADFRQVYENALEAWEEEMNKNYQTLMDKLSKQECRQKLENAQKAWLAFSNDEQSFNYSYWCLFQGTMYANNPLSYKTYSVRKRAFVLSLYYDKNISTADIYYQHKSSKTEEELDKMLNKNYQALMKKLSKENQGKLRLAQRKWITYRDAEDDCYNSCCLKTLNPDYRLFIIEERVNQLNYYLDDLIEYFGN